MKTIRYFYKTEIFTIVALAIIFYFIFFHNIGTYPLMDVDETRYVAISRDMFLSKDFLTLILNGNYFFEKPPLYFWQECFSFKIFGTINEFSARFPVALLGFIFSFVVYFSSKSWCNKIFAILTSLILASSLEFIILSKYAILDIVLTFYIGLSLVCFFNTYFCCEKYKKYFWWLFYLFSGLAVMAKGIPGFVIPFGTVFFCTIFSKNFREIFKPIYFLPGTFLFLLITLPWHIAMLKIHGSLFFDEYIIKHHLHRFFNTPNNEIGRKQPFYYYFCTVLWGFIPWIFSLFAVLVSRFKKIFDKNNYSLENFDFNKLGDRERILSLATICTLWIFLFFSASSTKLATYILPIYYPLALITAIIWEKFLRKRVFEKPIKYSIIFTGVISFVICFGAIFMDKFLPKQVNEYIYDIKIFSIIALFIFGSLIFYLLKKKKYLNIFIVYVSFMSIVSAFATEKFYETDYKFGQQDLIEFANFAQVNNLTISANGMDRKYSLLFYNDEKVDYNPNDLNVKEIKRDLNRENNVVIIKNKFLKELSKKISFRIIKKGQRYSMIKK